MNKVRNVIATLFTVINLSHVFEKSYLRSCSDLNGS